MDQENSENGTEDATVLPSCEDEHGGIIVELKEPMEPTEFALLLKSSLSQWKLLVILHPCFEITDLT